ncbi:hypothetical protein UF37_16000, partial [Vibrio parahaemolyticus]|uniref:Ig-like domain-containing protein n=1 Tax=Vibrio parahaemolyticus TaxID=670 RepID=UPI00062AFEA7
VNIDERGVVTALKTGVSVIRADLDEFSSEMTVQVVDAKLTNIYFDLPHKVIAKGLSFQAKAYGEYTDKQTRDISHLVEWDSTDCSVVMPGTNGIFTAQDEGDADIYAVFCLKKKKTPTSKQPRSGAGLLFLPPPGKLMLDPRSL